MTGLFLLRRVVVAGTAAMLASIAVRVLTWAARSRDPAALAAAVRVTAPFVLTSAAALAAAGRPWETRPARFAAAAWPLFAWPVLYEATVQVVELSCDDKVDAWLAAADAVVFRRPRPGPPDWPLGGAAEEAASAFYASYYAVIPLGFLWLWAWRGEAAAARYASAILLALAMCATAWVLFPAGGYHPNGSPSGPGYGPFTRLVRGIYTRRPHHAAAFPSSHVALAVAAASMLREAGAPPALWAWAAGVAWSTFYGQYHYFVDFPSGWLVGMLAAKTAQR